MKKLSLVVFASVFALSNAFSNTAYAANLTNYQVCSKMKPFAHRAMVSHDNTGRGWEDTVPAIKDAADQDIDAEIDVWHSKATNDDLLVVMHDQNVTNTTYQLPGSTALTSNLVDELNLAQIKTLRTNNYNYEVPTFEQALNGAAAKSTTSRLRVELKGLAAEWLDADFADFVAALQNGANPSGGNYTYDMRSRVQVFSSNLGLIKRFETYLTNSAPSIDIPTVWKYNKTSTWNGSAQTDEVVSQKADAVAIEYNMLSTGNMNEITGRGITLAARLANNAAEYKTYVEKNLVDATLSQQFKSIQSDKADDFKSWCNSQ